MTFKTLAAAAALSLITLPVFAEIMIEDAYARSASPIAKSGAAFMHIMNTGDTDDQLIDVFTDAARVTQLHTHIMDGAIANMVHVEEGFTIPAGGAAILERGGKHVMMMGLNGPFVDGEAITVTLVFEHAGEITLDILIDLERVPEEGMQHMDGMNHTDMGDMSGD
ncbi:MAG: copper chaperone PCu(A)C [Rhodobacteraceae bacterium]|nr:copper chaperone PCu(A)C [Paracoccaceae bacterium]